MGSSRVRRALIVIVGFPSRWDASSERFAMVVLSTFAVLAVLVSAIGLYGVISYVVARRRSEIGIRVALGAGRGAIAPLVIRDGLRLTAAD